MYQIPKPLYLKNGRIEFTALNHGSASFEGGRQTRFYTALLVACLHSKQTFSYE
jgi:hypothetical protein